MNPFNPIPLNREDIALAAAIAVLCAFALLFAGCSTTPTGNQIFDPNKAAQIVAERQGFIEAATATIASTVIYSVEKDDAKRLILNEQIHVVASNVQTLIDQGNFSPSAVTDALKIKEDYVDTILAGVASIYKAEYVRAQQNGYVQFAQQLLKAVAAGLADATITTVPAQ